MTTAEVKNRIAEHRVELREMGVASLELFGSTVREETSNPNDIDLLVEFSGPVGLFSFYRLQEYLEDLFFPERIDLVLRRSVIDDFKEQIYTEAIPCL